MAIPRFGVSMVKRRADPAPAGETGVMRWLCVMDAPFGAEC